MKLRNERANIEHFESFHMLNVRKRFRENVGSLLFGRDMMNINVILCVNFANIMIFRIDMFRAGVLNIIAGCLRIHKQEKRVRKRMVNQGKQFVR